MKFTLFAVFALILVPFAVFAAPPPTPSAPKPTKAPTPIPDEPEPTGTPTPPSAAPKFDGYSKCQVTGFKLSSPVAKCCTQNHGTSQIVGKVVRCRVPIGREGYYRKCIYDLHYSTTVTCRYY
ncbi:hypothetical protein BGZ73_004684 [Actinomortierella ambigua]|nr:hypothetical protein BGZ73_004684 [Actinomortierella ambigua]